MEVGLEINAIFENIYVKIPKSDMEFFFKSLRTKCV